MHTCNEGAEGDGKMALIPSEYMQLYMCIDKKHSLQNIISAASIYP